MYLSYREAMMDQIILIVCVDIAINSLQSVT